MSFLTAPNYTRVFPRRFGLPALSVSLVLLIGCSLLTDSNKTKEEKAAIEQKKQNYLLLRDTLMKGELPKGTSAGIIREKYGEPDTIFHSGSTESSFEIWTYEKVLEKDESEDWQPVRLYIDSGRLISWKY